MKKALSSICLIVLISAALRAQGRPLGMFVPTRGEWAETGQTAIAAARLALELAGPGTDTPALEIVGSEEQWGRQTTGLVDLIYHRNAAVILSGMDGRSAHLAAQVAARAKGRVLLILFSGEASLTETGIPWVLRMTPNAASQATVLRHLYPTSRSLLLADGKEPEQLASLLDPDAGVTTGLARGHGPDILVGTPDSLVEHAVLSKTGVMPRVAAPLSAIGDRAMRLFPDGVAWTRSFLDSGAGHRPTLQQFEAAYRREHGNAPPPLAYFVFDAVNLVLEAARAGHTGAEPLRDWLTGRTHRGVTGGIRFSDRGDRLFTEP